MDEPTANQFMISLVKSLQALCNGCIEFDSSVEVVGHIHLNIDRKVRVNYVLTEEVNKSASEDATLFSSHSYHSKPPQSQDSTDSVDRAPSPPRGSSSTSTNSRRKTQHVPRIDDSESFSFTTVPQPISVSQTKTNSVASKQISRDISHISNFQHSTSHDVQKPIASSASDSQDRRRKSSESLFQTSVMKQRRLNEVDIKTEPEIISIKEEVASDDETMAEELPGQDMAAPDFSNIMVESLDHADQNEVSSLVTGDCAQMMQPVETAGDSGPQIQLQPYPVMLHTISKSPVLSGPSTSTQPVPSTSTDRLQPKVSSSLSMEFREYKKYSQADAARALHLVHMGLSLSASQMQSGVPMTTIFRMTKRCQEHRGNCRGAYVLPLGHR